MTPDHNIHTFTEQRERSRTYGSLKYRHISLGSPPHLGQHRLWLQRRCFEYLLPEEQVFVDHPYHLWQNTYLSTLSVGDTVQAGERVDPAPIYQKIPSLHTRSCADRESSPIDTTSKRKIKSSINGDVQVKTDDVLPAAYIVIFVKVSVPTAVQKFARGLRKVDVDMSMSKFPDGERLDARIWDSLEDCWKHQKRRKRGGKSLNGDESIMNLALSDDSLDETERSRVP
ncbi:hypothetical protein C8R42DRAFT_722205 [Lentinula raphanica]|nr:hypothetical protein C8R42DRAFT_722205 [Lentinula raphanica]